MTTEPVIATIVNVMPHFRFSYVNHNGKKEVRNVIAPCIFWGVSDFYPEPQWLLNAYCTDRKALRTFAFGAITLLEQDR